eukprot:3899293-Pleurochrysis_carterae.AAC.1
MQVRRQAVRPRLVATMGSVSLPWVGLGPRETFRTVVEALLQLDDAVDASLSAVEQRVQAESFVLQQLEERIRNAGERSSRVKGTSAATVVYSTS